MAKRKRQRYGAMLAKGLTNNAMGVWVPNPHTVERALLEALAMAHKERNKRAGCVQPSAEFKAKRGWLK